MDDDQLQREIETLQAILHVRLRRHAREMREIDRDLRALRTLQKSRRSAAAPVVVEGSAPQEASP